MDKRGSIVIMISLNIKSGRKKIEVHTLHYKTENPNFIWFVIIKKSNTHVII